MPPPQHFSARSSAPAAIPPRIVFPDPADREGQLDLPVVAREAGGNLRMHLARHPDDPACAD